MLTKQDFFSESKLTLLLNKMCDMEYAPVRLIRNQPEILHPYTSKRRAMPVSQA